MVFLIAPRGVPALFLCALSVCLLDQAPEARLVRASRVAGGARQPLLDETNTSRNTSFAAGSPLPRSPEPQHSGRATPGTVTPGSPPPLDLNPVVHDMGMGPHEMQTRAEREAQEEAKSRQTAKNAEETRSLGAMLGVLILGYNMMNFNVLDKTIFLPENEILYKGMYAVNVVGLL